MQVLRLMCRSLLSPAVIAMLLAPTQFAGAVDATASNPTLSDARTGYLIFTPSNLHFGRVSVGRRKTQTVTITNSGDSDVTLLQFSTEARGFRFTGLDLPLTLARGESFTFGAVFAPHSSGASSGRASLVSDIANPVLMLDMAGVGADDVGLSVNPATMNFGNVQVGSGASQAGSLIAGDEPVTISSATSSSVEFTLSGLSFPVTIPAGGSQGFLVTFIPQESGAASATLTFQNASSSPLAVESLNGIGVVSQNHSVDLSWNASTSQNVIGYNVYRGGQSGGPYSKINSVLDPSTVYTDTSVIDGNTYYYVTTAVNSDNQESVYSNEAQAVIP